MNEWAVAKAALDALAPIAESVLRGKQFDAFIETRRAVALQVNKATTAAAKKAKGR